MLSEKQLADYHRDGYLVIEDFSSLADCAKLKVRAGEIVEAFEPDTISVFTTNEQQRNADDYFLTSGDKVRCFFEEEAIDADGKMLVEKNLSINKLGHAMHELDPVFRSFASDPRLAQYCDQVGMVDPRVLQSMYIFKQPRIGGEVGVHQDSTFLYTDPLSCVAFWFALEDATLENGCLWGLPGGHTLPLEKIMKRREDGNGVEFEQLAQVSFDLDKLVSLPVKAGTLVMFDGRFPHLSYANRSEKTRHAFTLHVVSGDTDYPDFNWLQREDGSPFLSFSELADDPR